MRAPQPAAGPLHAFSGGFLGPGALPRRIRRIMALAGYPLRPGWPRAQGAVAVWGHGPRAWRGEWVAARSGAGLVRIEDAFLRSVHPARSGGEPPIGLMIDPGGGAHYAPAEASSLERLLATHPLDDHALLERARIGAQRLAALDLSKYNAHDPTLDLPPPGYVLVIDQVMGDASLRYGALDGPLPPRVFREMLIAAQAENPGARIIIKTHPETIAGQRAGHFGPGDTTDRVRLLDTAVSPWKLLDGARAVYTVSSQLGFEAIFAGHRPRVFGLPFYAGWGLSVDEQPHPRRQRRLSRAQLFAAAMLIAPTWYDPARDRLCSFEDALDHLEARLRAWREDRAGHVALGMRLWKRAHLQGFFGHWRRLRFAANPERAVAQARNAGRGLMVWAGHEPPELAPMAAAAPLPVPLRRIEDGFLRSRGLGAALVPPLSLVSDDLGIYYDPTRESRLERLIAAPPPPGGISRAERLIARLRAAGLSKYNLGAAPPPALPPGYRVLVPGQVEDDASIRLGATGVVRGNLDLLRAARAARPEAVILYKPHPDVEAGLRPGALSPDVTRDLADMVLDNVDPAAVIAAVDEVWTLTSLTGFEALLRGKRVITLGAPFYAGWGLTEDHAPLPARRAARPTLAALVHAALIAYPRYLDPLTGAPCPVEVALERLGDTRPGRPGAGLRALSKLQGLLASQARWWR